MAISGVFDTVRRTAQLVALDSRTRADGVSILGRSWKPAAIGILTVSAAASGLSALAQRDDAHTTKIVGQSEPTVLISEAAASELHDRVAHYATPANNPPPDSPPPFLGQ